MVHRDASASVSGLVAVAAILLFSQVLANEAAASPLLKKIGDDVMNGEDNVVHEVYLPQTKNSEVADIDGISPETDALTDGSGHPPNLVSVSLRSMRQRRALSGARKRLKHLSVELGVDFDTAVKCEGSGELARALMKSIENSVDAQENSLMIVFTNKDTACLNSAVDLDLAIKGAWTKAIKLEKDLLKRVNASKANRVTAKATNDTYRAAQNADKLKYVTAAIKCHCSVIIHYQRAYKVVQDSDMAAKREHAYEQAQMMLCLQAGEKPSDCVLKHLSVIKPVNLDPEVEAACPRYVESSYLGYANKAWEEPHVHDPNEPYDQETMHNVTENFDRDPPGQDLHHDVNQGTELETATTIKRVHAQDFTASDWVKPGSSMWVWGLDDDEMHLNPQITVSP